MGVKFGSTVRKRFTSISSTLQAKRNCPTCGSPKFKREAVGIWTCFKCGLSFAGEAYDIKL